MGVAVISVIRRVATVRVAPKNFILNGKVKTAYMIDWVEVDER